MNMDRSLIAGSLHGVVVIARLCNYVSKATEHVYRSTASNAAEFGWMNQSVLQEIYYKFGMGRSMYEATKILEASISSVKLD